MAGSFIPSTFNTTYGSNLGAVLHAPYLWDTDYALSQDEDSYDLMRRDAIVAHALDFRKHLVAGLSWYLEPASQSPVDLKVTRIIEQLLRAIPHFAEVRFNLAEAVIRGEAWAGIRGAFVSRAIASGKVRRWWQITEIVDIDKRRFRRKKLEVPGRPTRWVWEIERVFAGRWDELEPLHYVHHVHGTAEETLGRGHGVGSVIWHYWRNKVQCLKLWLQRLDRWALGNLVAKVALDEDARRDPANSERIDSWLKVLEKMRAGHVCVFDARDAIELVEAEGEGSEIREALRYHDEAITRAALGAVLPTGGSQGVGSYARADVEAESTEAVIAYDHQNLGETIDHSAVALLFNANYRALCADAGGVPSGAPNIMIRGGRRQDPLVEVKIVEAALRARIPLKKSEVYAALRYTPPAPGDAVFDGADLGPAAADPSSPTSSPTNGNGGTKDSSRPKPSGPKAYELEHGLEAGTGNGTRELMLCTPITIQPPQVQVAVAAPQVHVDVAAPQVTIAPAAPIVVPAPQVHVAAAAPVVIPAPVVNVLPKDHDKKLTVERDAQGRVSGLTVEGGSG